MAGWLPVEISYGDFPFMFWPGLVTGARVQWMYFGSKRLTEPFFRQSVEGLRAGKLPAIEFGASLESLFSERHPSTSSIPAGFIFHISRCGSTIIANALKATQRGQVIAEASPITRLFMPCNLGRTSDARREQDRRFIAECLFDVYASYLGPPEPIIVKFASQNSLCVPLIRRCWPDVPCLFIIRDPIQVLVSNLAGTSLNRFRECPLLAAEMAGLGSVTSLSDITNEEFCARVVGRYLATALHCRDSGVMVLDYDDINAQTFVQIARYLGVDCEIDDLIHKVFKAYSKDPTGRRVFKDDRRRKLNQATCAIVNAAERWATPYYNSLRDNMKMG